MAPPRILIEPLSAQPREAPATWQVTWRVVNHAARELCLEAAWLPHGRFRAAATDFQPPRCLQPGAAVEVTLPARFEEAPGTAVENCFVIFRAWQGHEQWRILCRLRVTAGPSGTPEPRPEVVTYHRIGFSQQSG